MIRWIRDWLGTAAYNDSHNGDWLVVDVRHHVDKGGNSGEALLQSIECALAARSQGRRVVVACDFGISRSNAIAAGILSRWDNCSFDEALSYVTTVTGETQMKLEMIASVRAALGEGGAARSKSVVLITGGTGFLGRRMAVSLAESYVVRSPTRAELNLARGGTALAQYCERADVGQIVHLAYPRQYTNPAAMAESLAMLGAVLDVSKLLDLRVIVLSGWVVFSGYATTALLADESQALRSKGTYGDSKLLEETLVGAYVQRGDIRAAVCRLAPVYGPGGERPRLIRNFAEAIATGRKVITHRYLNGRPALDLLHVEDAVSALAAVLRSEQSGVFHFGTGQLTETQTIAWHLARLLGAPLQHEEVAIEDETSNIAMVSSKVCRLFGWRAKISLEKGLAEMVRSGDLGPLPGVAFSRL